MARASRLELHLASPEKLPHAVGVRVLDAAFAQELVSLPDRGDLPLLHALFELFEGFGRDQLLAATLTHPAKQELSQAALPVFRKPSLALTPAVA
jgi:hypothetical protein